MSETAACDSPGRKIGFVGDSGVGKTMVATVVAARIREEAAFAVHGEASEIVSPETRTVESGVIDSWVVYDASAGPKGFTEIADEMDVAFVVATPERLDSVRAYEAIASATDTDLFSVINRFSEDDRERLRAFEGPSLAEYFFEREAIRETLLVVTYRRWKSGRSTPSLSPPSSPNPMSSKTVSRRSSVATSRSSTSKSLTATLQKGRSMDS